MGRQELEQSIKTAQQQGEKDQLEMLAKEAVSAYPEAPFGYAYLAEAMLMKFPTPYDKAEYCLAKASELDPKNTQYLSSFASLKSKQGDENIAQIFWTKILLLDSNHLEALIAKGDYELNVTFDYQKALKLFTQAIKHHADHVEGYLYRSKAFCQLQDYDKALKDYYQGIKINGGVEDIQALSLKLNILLGIGNSEDIIAAYQAILALNPNLAHFHSACAEHLVALGRYKEAADYYSNASELLGHKDHILAYEWGEALYNDGRYTEALQAFDIYIKHAENPELALLKQIPIYVQMQDYQTALEKVAAARKQNSDLLPEDFLDFHAGEILFGLEDYTEALKYLKKLTHDSTSYQEEAIYLIGKIAFSNDELHRSYHAMRFSSGLGFEPATTFLREELHDFFDFFLIDFFKTTDDLIANNAASAFIQQYQGKLWCFEDIEGESIQEFPPKLADNLKKEMAVTTLIITDKAFLKLSKSAVTLYTYKIMKETENSISFPVKNIHKTAERGAELEIDLTINEEGLLEYEDNLNPNSVMTFKEANPEMLSEEAVNLFQKFIHQETFGRLGDVIKPIAQHIWKYPLLETT